MLLMVDLDFQGHKYIWLWLKNIGPQNRAANSQHEQLWKSLSHRNFKP